MPERFRERPGGRSLPQVVLLGSAPARARIADQQGGQAALAGLDARSIRPPYMARLRFAARYDSGDTVLPEPPDPAALSEHLARYARAMGFGALTREDMTETMRCYYAQVEWGVDRPLGRVLRTLEHQGLAETTIVAADHGDFMGHYGMVRKGMFLCDALLLWWAPGRIAAGTVTDALTQSTDIFPTLIEMTGGELPETSGVSIASTLMRREPGRSEIYSSAANGDLAPDVLPPDLAPRDEDAVPRHTRILPPAMSPIHRTKMVRTREWRFILNETEPAEQDQIADSRPGERENLDNSAENAATPRRVERELSNWWRW